jgi:hypothetical protein
MAISGVSTGTCPISGTATDDKANLEIVLSNGNSGLLDSSELKGRRMIVEYSGAGSGNTTVARTTTQVHAPVGRR